MREGAEHLVLTGRVGLAAVLERAAGFVMQRATKRRHRPGRGTERDRRRRRAMVGQETAGTVDGSGDARSDRLVDG